ncbi:hypothetical protein VVATL9824_01051 [Vibrio vulnificus]|nr:hypothetical protein VVATL9824_01051 [Vibrio vulnificus]
MHYLSLSTSGNWYFHDQNIVTSLFTILKSNSRYVPNQTYPTQEKGDRPWNHWRFQDLRQKLINSSIHSVHQQFGLTDYE